MNWTDKTTLTSIRDDGAKVGGFPDGEGGIEYWAYPPGWRPRDYDGHEPQGPHKTLQEAKASLQTMLPLWGEGATQ